MSLLNLLETDIEILGEPTENWPAMEPSASKKPLNQAF